jgi:hypothetical protein
VTTSTPARPPRCAGALFPTTTCTPGRCRRDAARARTEATIATTIDAMTSRGRAVTRRSHGRRSTRPESDAIDEAHPPRTRLTNRRTARGYSRFAVAPPPCKSASMVGDGDNAPQRCLLGQQGRGHCAGESAARRTGDGGAVGPGRPIEPGDGSRPTSSGPLRSGCPLGRRCPMIWCGADTITAIRLASIRMWLSRGQCAHCRPVLGAARAFHGFDVAGAGTRLARQFTTHRLVTIRQLLATR